MKPTHILYMALTVLLFSCTERIEEEMPMPVDHNTTKKYETTFSGGSDHVSVFIFRENQSLFSYYSVVNSGWSPEGKVTVALPLGNYKFLFTGPFGTRSSLSPDPLTSDSRFEDIRFLAKEETSGFVLPVDELFLQDPQLADSIYQIRQPATVSCLLKRVTSEAVFILKRGYPDGNEYRPLPYSDGKNILNHIQALDVTLENVATTLNLQGTDGSGKLHVTLTPADQDSLTGEGFVVFQGIKVFPSPTGISSRISLSLTPAPGSSYPTLTLPELTGTFMKNKKLLVTIWVTSTYQYIGITVNTEDISQQTNGDLGIWQ